MVGIFVRIILDWRSEYLVVILRGRDVHRRHHAAAKCILYLKNAGPPMQNLGAFRAIAELNLKVSPRIELETVIGVSNSCHLAMVCIEK